MTSHPSGGRSVYGGGGGTVFLAGAAAGAAAGLLAVYTIEVASLWPGQWWGDKVSVYPFNSTYEWNFHNATLDKNMTMPVACLCSISQSCTCQGTNDPAFIADVMKNGTWEALDHTLVSIGNLTVDKVTEPTILLNGTVANGTQSSGAMSVMGGSSSMALSAAIFASVITLLL